MYLIPFYVVEPELAEHETRTITLFKPQDNLPPDTYALIESYCPDPTCDCRRVMLNVVGKESPQRGYLASISYGFDRDEELAGPFLDALNPQSKYAESLLDMVSDWVLRDPRYLRRLERHYRLVKEAAADPSHPAYHEIQRVLADEDEDVPQIRLPGKRVGGHRNGPFGRVGGHRNGPFESVGGYRNGPSERVGGYRNGPSESVGGHRNGPFRRVGRNDPCPCGSGKKYKHCCMRKDGRR